MIVWTQNGETDLVSISSNIQSPVIAKICVKRKNGEKLGEMIEDSSKSFPKKGGEYFEWVCDKCKWGARGYDKMGIIDMKEQHDELGCKEFISMIESRGRKLEN